MAYSDMIPGASAKMSGVYEGSFDVMCARSLLMEGRISLQVREVEVGPKVTKHLRNRGQSTEVDIALNPHPHETFIAFCRSDVEGGLSMDVRPVD